LAVARNEICGNPFSIRAREVGSAWAARLAGLLGVHFAGRARFLLCCENMSMSMNNVIALTEPRVIARLDALERRLEALEARGRDDALAAGEVADQIITIAALLVPGSAHGGATATDGMAAK
jgi:hypothetical protein